MSATKTATNSRNLKCLVLDAAIGVTPAGDAAELQLLALVTNVNGIERGPVAETANMAEWFVRITTPKAKHEKEYKSLAAARAAFDTTKAQIK